MPAVRVSPKFQVVIPREIRERLSIEAGQKVEVFDRDDHIVLVPLRPMHELRGSLPGIDTTVEREPDRL